MQRSPKAMLLRPTNVDLPECDCHLPPMESDGRRSRPVVHCCYEVVLRYLYLNPIFGGALLRVFRVNTRHTEHSPHHGMVAWHELLFANSMENENLLARDKLNGA